MPIPISITNLSKVYRSSPLAKPTPAVDNVSLDIAPGELFFLLGPSGCGKTTLLRMIAGFIEPSRSPNPGRIRFADRDVTHTPPNKRNTAMVFQSYALWPHMTVARNVAFGLSVRKTPVSERDKRVKEALEAVQLAEFADRKPNQLSGGQQQRVALARALVIRPDVLLLDEPLSNLDAKLRADLRLQVREICKAAGITSVYVTHDQHEALSMADRIAIMRDGRIEQLGTPRELYTRPRSAFVATFLGEANILPARIIQTPAFSKPTSTVPPTPGAVATNASETVYQPILTPPSSPNDPRVPDSPEATASARRAERPITNSPPTTQRTDPIDGELVRVETPIGIIFAVPSTSFEPSGDQVAAWQVMIRPEAVAIVAAATPGAIPATLRQTQYLGNAVQCVCRVREHDLIVTAPSDLAPTASDVALQINPYGTILLGPA